MQKMLIGFLFCSLCSCVKISEIEDDPVSSQSLPSPIERAHAPVDDKLELLVHEKPNAYEVKLPVPEGATIATRFRLVTAESDQVEEASAQPLAMEPVGGFIYDRSPEPGSRYLYKFSRGSGSEIQSLKNYIAEIPMDLVIDREFVLDRPERWSLFRRIFFTPSGVITTLGNAFSIQADQLISDRGTIRTFPPNSQAAVGPGHDGGAVSLSLRTASGRLFVELRGSRGANGAPGAPLPWVEYPNRPMRNDEGGVGRAYPPGRKGNSGSAGLPGGATGTAHIQYSEASPLEVISSFEPGAGGSGGPGGPGEQVDALQKPGPPGDAGASGPTGVKQDICITGPAGSYCQ